MANIALTPDSKASGSEFAERLFMAERRAQMLARSSDALQATIEALGEAIDLDQVVPRVLTVVAETFRSISCAVYENDSLGWIQLRYWNVDGRTLAPDELLQLDPKKFGLVRMLADGFEVPDDYLGMPATAIGTVVLDHVRGTSIPEFDAFVLGVGWDLELNVGVGAGGVRTSTLVICRQAGDPFTPMEIALAESLGTQVGLAVEFARLADEAKQSAISHEREVTARERAAELSKANDAMRQAIESLAIEPDLISFAGRLLMIIGQQFGAPVVEYWTNDSAHVARLRLTCRDGQLYPGSDMKGDPRVLGIVIPEEMTGAPDLYTPRSYFMSVDLPSDMGQQAVYSPLGLDLASWCSERGVSKHLNVPLRSGGQTFGALVIYIPMEQQFTDVRIELAYALAHQMTLAIRLTDLALESQRATIAKEREEAAMTRATELAKANKAITDSLRRMATESDLSRMPGMILLEVCRYAGADACCWLDYDPDHHTLHLTLRSWQGNVSDQPGRDEPPIFRLPFAADITPAFEYLLATDELVELSAPALHDYVWPGVMKWHNNNGRTAMLAYAVKVGDQPVGVLGMGFSRSVDMTRSQRELIRALANHLALAVHLTRLSRRANSAALLNERNRIARDIHDSLAQNFTGILMQLQAANRFSEKDPEVARACVDRAEKLARNGLKEARRSVMSLVKEDERYQDIGLALRSLVETATADTGTRAVVNISGDTRSLHPLTAVNLLRVCQEALGNAQRYARAEQIKVELAFTHESVRLTVEDDGVGFVPADVTGGGFGLAGMRERAERINGALTIDSAPERGTRIVIEGPLNEPAEVLH